MTGSFTAHPSPYEQSLFLAHILVSWRLNHLCLTRSFIPSIDRLLGWALLCFFNIFSLQSPILFVCPNYFRNILWSTHSNKLLLNPQLSLISLFLILDLHTKPDSWESMRKNAVYVGFIDLEKAYDRVNKEALWQVLRMYDVGIKCWVELRVCWQFSLCQSKKGWDWAV